MLLTKDTNEKTLYRLAYVSHATTKFDRVELLGMLNKFRSANQSFDITGILLHKDDEFMQLLEGPQSAVLSLFARIQIDPRNNDVVVMTQGAIHERQFSNWSMAFRDLDTQEAKVTPGYSDFLNIPFHAIPFIRQPNQSQELMLVFRATLP